MTTAAQKHVTDARDALDRRDHPQCLLLVRAGFAASPSNEDLEELLAVTRELSQGRSSVAAQARPLVAGLEGALRSRRQVPPTPPQPEYLDELIAAVRGYLDDGRETLAVTLLDDEIAEAAARRDADHLSALRQRLGGLANPPEAIASRTARVDDEVERIRWAEKRAGSTGGAPTAESTPRAAPKATPRHVTPSPPPYRYESESTNGLAIASLVLGIVWIYGLGSILALVFGYIAKGQIDDGGGRQGGRGMAIAGIVLGWIGVAGIVLFLILGLALLPSWG
jgi:hypothetical protein